MARKTRGSLILRNGTYYLLYFLDGKRHRFSLHTSDQEEAEAQREKHMAPILLEEDAKQLRALRHEIADAEGDQAQAQAVLDEERRERLPVAAAWDAYVKTKKRPQSSAITLKDYCYQWKQFVEWWGPPGSGSQGRHLMEEVTSDDADAFAGHVERGGVSANRYNKTIGTCRRVFHILASKCNGRPNPFGESARTGIPNKRLQPEGQRALTEAELRKVCGHAKGEMRLLMTIGLYTGLRLGDACTLRWEEVKLPRGRIVRQPNKTRARTGKTLLIPLYPALRQILEEIPGGERQGFVLPDAAALYAKDPSALSRAIAQQFVDCGIKTTAKGRGVRRRCIVGFHSLRHSFVTLCAEQGVPLAVVQELCGHSSPEIQRAYLHMGEEVTRKAISALPDISKPAKRGKAAPQGEAEKLAAIRAVIGEKKRLSPTDRAILAILGG